MDLRLQLSLILGVIIYLTILLQLLRKRSLDLKYTLVWIFSGIVMMFIAIFPSIINGITKFIGIVDATNGLFAIVLFLLILILMSITSIVSNMKKKNTQLTQQCALLEKRIQNIENKCEMYRRE